MPDYTVKPDIDTLLRSDNNAAARTNLGVQAALTSTSPLGLSQGGTGAINASAALAALSGVPTTRTLSVGTGLTGGGDLSANRTISISSISTSQIAGLGGAAVLSVGTTAGTVAAGDDSRMVNAALKSLNNTFTASQTIAASASAAILTAQQTGGGTGASLAAIQTSTGAGAGLTVDIQNTSSTAPAVRITNQGAGNSLLVEDIANPDSTPFAIDTDGNVIAGSTAVNTSLTPLSGTSKVQILGGAAPIAFIRETTNSTPINVEFAKKKTTTGVLLANESIGKLRFTGNDGTAQVESAYIEASIDSTAPAANSMPGKIVLATTPAGSATPVERLRIASDGTSTFSGPTVIEATSASPALRITQNDPAAGNVLVVEDKNTDNTPFVINADGTIICGNATSVLVNNATTKLQSLTSGSYPFDAAAWSATGATASINFAKSRSGIIGTPGVVSVGDNVAIEMRLDKGDGFASGAKIVATAESAPTTTSLPTKLGFSTCPSGSTTALERMTISPAGKVGIGTAPDSTAALKVDTNGIMFGDGTTQTTAATGGGTPTNVQVFTSSGTWTKPAGAIAVDVVVISAGGGGGSGRKAGVGSQASGGGGGGGGSYSIRNISASLLGATETVTVGSGGTGGAAVSVNSTNGNAGGTGGNSSFGTWVQVQGGGGAAVATTASGGAGASASARAMFQGANGGAGGGGTGTGGSNATTGAAGGGSGGGLPASATVGFAGGAGGTALGTWLSGGGGSAGAIATNGGAGSNVTATFPASSGGGGGGGSSVTGNAGSGGNGGTYGGGGGGGGGGLDSVGNSGAGGNGADGIVIVTTYF